MTVLLAFFRIMNDTELKERYAQEPWGKLLIKMGMEPYDTESSARRVAEYAAERIEMLTSAIERMGTDASAIQCLSYGPDGDCGAVRIAERIEYECDQILQANVNMEAPNA
jgi:hypothetical protein